MLVFTCFILRLVDLISDTSISVSTKNDSHFARNRNGAKVDFSVAKREYSSFAFSVRGDRVSIPISRSFLVRAAHTAFYIPIILKHGISCDHSGSNSDLYGCGGGR